VAVGQKLNEIHSLTQAIIHLNQKDPRKQNPTIQKQISDIKATIKARRLGMQANAKSLDANLGKQPPAQVAHLHAPRPVPVHAPPKPAPVAAVAPVAPPPQPPPRVGAYHPYPSHARFASIPPVRPHLTAPHRPVPHALPHLAQTVKPPASHAA